MSCRLRLPGSTAHKIVFGNLSQKSTARVSHRVVNKTDVGTPAGVSPVNCLDLSFARLIGPQRSKVKVVLRQACEFLAQLAGPHVAVVIDHCRRLAGSARHWPRGRLPEVGRLGSVVSS